eukprot:1713599-Prymnesium_polylepis.1
MHDPSVSVIRVVIIYRLGRLDSHTSSQSLLTSLAGPLPPRSSCLARAFTAPRQSPLAAPGSPRARRRSCRLPAWARSGQTSCTSYPTRRPRPASLRRDDSAGRGATSRSCRA